MNMATNRYICGILVIKNTVLLRIANLGYILVLADSFICPIVNLCNAGSWA